MDLRGLAGLCAALAALSSTRSATQATVLPTVETLPVPTSGDAADDAVVWVHPTVPGLSTVIGTDKDAGLAVYDLAGNLLQFLADGELNNVDLRQDFQLGGSSVALVTSAERNGNVLAAYVVNPQTRLLQDVVARPIPLLPDAYGCCMYRSPVTGDVHFFATSEDGGVEQWRLFDNGAGRVDALRVRTFDVGSTTEGCVADDEATYLFLSEEGEGIWRYGAEPGSAPTRVQVDTTGPGGHLTEDVEGLSLYYAAGGAGYLIASSQGSDTYVVYDRRPPHAFRTSFRIGDNVPLGIDGTQGTDGLDVMNLGLGSAFPGGVFVAQDGTNPGANQNFKLVPWTAVASTATPPLLVDTTYAPESDPTRPPRARDCSAAEASPRNGSGSNPVALFTARTPELGSSWACELDCAGHAPAMASIAGYSRPSAGTFVRPYGELLLDLGSTLYFFLPTPHAGNRKTFDIHIPADPRLCGLRFYVQGLCEGAPGPKFSNGLALRIGF